MRAMARSAVVVGLSILGLMLAATMLSVMFATRGAMSTNRQSSRCCMWSAPRRALSRANSSATSCCSASRAGAIGGGAAMVLFALVGMMSDWFKGTAGESQASALFGSLSIGPEGYGAVIGLVVLVAAVTAGPRDLRSRARSRPWNDPICLAGGPGAMMRPGCDMADPHQAPLSGVGASAAGRAVMFGLLVSC